MTGRSPPTSPHKRQRLSSNPSSTDITSRVIIALDLDAFYVSACRKRDPSLIGIPIGIQQKALVATISYEARAAGVDKLDSIKDALKKCPDMVLVNGEDLTYFRQVSSEVWRLVRGIVWEKRVEKLGMDELFCDVTEMVDHHLATVARVGMGGKRWFDLTPPGRSSTDATFGFEYEPWPTDNPAHIHPDAASEWLAQSRPDWWQERMLAASHLAFYLRSRIANEIGLTCTAGIAPSKSQAKLVGALNKPNQQTCFAPPIGNTNKSAEEAAILRHITAFLDPLDLRKLPGFGRVVVDKIREHLEPSSTSLTSAQTAPSRRPRVNFMEPTPLAEEETEKKKLKVSVGTARKMLSLETMLDLFGEVIGPKLWALVCGRDMEPVIPAPDFPLQLSIEDTYPYPSLRGASIHQEIARLSMSLLRRLELELTSQPSTSSDLQAVPRSQEKVVKHESVVIRDYTDVSSDSSKAQGTWLRYPLKLRLSIRQGWSNRVSKQTKMPVEIFELDKRKEERATAIAKACKGLLRALIGGDDVTGDGMNLINIAALELSERRPQRALGSFFGAKVKEGDTTTQGSGEQIDKAFLASLPSELQAEIALEYGIELAEPSRSAASDADEAKVEPKGKGRAILKASLICRDCGEEMQVWMQHDHELYPVSGLPDSSTSKTLVEETDDGSEGEPEKEGDVDEDDTVECDQCNEPLKPFALVAHQRFHQLQNEAF